MESNAYQKWAKTKDRNSGQYIEWHGRLNGYNKLEIMHAVLGIAGESGEIVDAFKKATLYGKPLDVENMKEECGDILWYMSILLTALGSSFEEVMKMNHDKLEKRYPSGFTEHDARTRADKVEEKHENAAGTHCTGRFT